MLAWAKTIEQMPLAAEVFEQTATRDLKQAVTPKPDEHRQQQQQQKHWVVFSPSVLILSCLQSTLSLHSSPTYSFIVSTLTSFLFF